MFIYIIEWKRQYIMERVGDLELPQANDNWLKLPQANDNWSNDELF